MFANLGVDGNKIMMLPVTDVEIRIALIALAKYADDARYELSEYPNDYEESEIAKQTAEIEQAEALFRRFNRLRK